MGATRLVAAALAVAALLAPGAPSSANGPTVDVVFVANAESGTVDVIDASTFAVVRTLNVIPDGDEPDPFLDPVQAAAFPLVVGAAGHNYAQDLDVSPDGTTLYVSRGHLGDVAAFDLITGGLLWKTPVGGFRADHMEISADGARLYVSAITDSAVEVLDSATGALIGSFPTGEWSHDNHRSPDGTLVYNGSIGNVLTPQEARDIRSLALRGTIPGATRITIADATSLEVVDTIEFDRGVRPFVITPDGSRLYAQLSEYHGLVEYDLTAGREIRRVQLPIADGVTSDDYDFEAPHHGLALSPDGTTLCVAGRASDYAALVSTATMLPVAILGVGDAPGWAGNDPDGSHCYLASTRADTVSVVSYASKSVVATISVGDGPKYITSATVPAVVVRS